MHQWLLDYLKTEKSAFHIEELVWKKKQNENIIWKVIKKFIN